MNSSRFVVAYLLMTLASSAISEVPSSYISSTKPFLEIKDPNRQADAWGTCAAAYQITAELMEVDSNNAKLFKEQSNGASVAVVMTHVHAGLKKDMKQFEFNALWKFSKTLMQSIPEVQRTRILSDLEYSAENGSSMFFDKLKNTLEICTKNLNGQQFYVDAWRNLAKSGLLQIPD
jgi:hypothetical protein